MALRMSNIDVNTLPRIKIKTHGEWNDPALNDLDKQLVSHIGVRIIFLNPCSLSRKSSLTH